MEQTYSVELSAEEIAELSRLVGRDIDTARTDDEYENMRATWDHIGFALRNAQPVQPSALQRLEEWQEDATQTRAYSVQVGKGVYVVWLYVKGHRIGKSIAPTLADAINAALGAAEGAGNE